MKITVHSIYDILTGQNINYGINDVGYNKCIADLNAGKCADQTRYVYFKCDVEIKFMWDVTENEFDAMRTPGRDDGIDVSEYFGAVFFGDFKLEFIWNDVGGVYNNLFFYGAEDIHGEAYAYLEDGSPYEDIIPDLDVVKSRTFDAFAKKTEETLVKWLNGRPEFIEYAIKETDPKKWYPDGQCNITRDITRVA